MTDYSNVRNDTIPNMDSINDFLLSKKLENKSIETIKAYRKCLVGFFKCVPKHIKDIKKEDILDWIVKYSKTIKEVTLKNRLTVLNVYFKYCQDEGYIDRNIIRSRWKPKIAYFGNIRTLIPATSGQHFGIIRTPFRQHPDTLSS